MISKEKAIQTLKEYWRTENFIFQADFHISKNIRVREGEKPFGYFRNFRLNGKLIDYPQESPAIRNRRISIIHNIEGGLEDNQRYEVEVELDENKVRKRNPFLLRVKRFKKIEKNGDSTKDGILKKAINDIFQENININSPFQIVNIANSVESLATDIYSENKRFIYELIQNADDAAIMGHTELSIDFSDNYVVISHNGKPFDSRDIRGLCSIGMGTKAEDASKTGYKGIGFKSVFGQPDGIVFVKTGNTLFRFDRDFSNKKSWNGEWGTKETWEAENGVEFHCPWQMMPILSDKTGNKETDLLLDRKKYSVKTAIKIKNGKELFDDIISLFEDAKFMLFLRKVKTVKLNSKNRQVTIEKVQHKEITEAVSLQKNGNLLSSWYVKNWTEGIPDEIQEELKSDSKTPKKIQSMTKTEISFALPLNKTNDEIQLLKENDSALYSYLPTSVKEFNIPFIVNCNFLLDAGREKIHKNRKWNEWLFQVIGYKTVECCSDFAQNNRFSSTYLSVLRNGFYDNFNNLSKKLNEGLEKGFKRFPIVRNQLNTLCKLDAVYFDPFEVNKLDFSFTNQLVKYINETHRNFSLSGNNIIPLTEENKVLKKFKPKVLNEYLLRKFFDSNHFEDSIKLNNNVSILEFVKPFEEKDASGEWYVIVTNNKFIISQDNELDFVTGVCFPMEVLAVKDEEYQNRLIHQDVYDGIKGNGELFAWLEKLGVTEPGSIAYLEKDIIGKIDSCITEDNFLNLTKFIFDLHISERLEKHHYVSLQELPLKTKDGYFEKANQCILPTAYNPTLDFSEVLKNPVLLSDDYLELANPQDCRTFFKLLNVTDDIDFIQTSIRLSSNLNAEYVKESYAFSKEGHSYPHLIGLDHNNVNIREVTFYLQTFSFFDELTSLSIAELFWTRLFDKFQLKKDKEFLLEESYADSKDCIAYSLGNNQSLMTLDRMKWGRRLSNRVNTLGYFFWRIKHKSCIPTTCGMRLAKESFVNTEYNKKLAGDFLPIIKLNNPVPEDWTKVLGLKTQFSIADLLVILQGLSKLVFSKNSLSKENETRIGLVYNELLNRLNRDEYNTKEKIKKWANNNQLVSSSKKSLNPQELLWINIPGFNNVLSGIETILLPKNIETSNPNLEYLLRVFGVKIVEEFSYHADNQKEFYDLKIKLLKLIGPLGLLLKNKLQISDLNRFIYERLQKVSETEFIKCQNIHPVFKYKSEDIAGETLTYCYDKKEEQFLISINWESPVTLLNVSYDLSFLLSAVRVEKELMMLLLLNDKQILEYLKSLNLNPSEYERCNSYEEVLAYIEKLNEKMNPTISDYVEASKINEVDKEEVKAVNEPEEDIVEETLEDDIYEEKMEIEESEKARKIEYSKEDLIYLEKLFGRELGDDQLEEENLYAQVKALRYFKDRGYDISQAEDNFETTYKNKYLSPIIDEGDSFTVMCRSARKGMLFLGAYAWTKLVDQNTLLYVLTGDTSSNCVLIRDQQELEDKFDSYYKVLRRENTSYIDLKELINAESELSDLQILYKVKSGSFDIIFNPQKNEVGVTGGPLISIGEDK